LTIIGLLHDRRTVATAEETFLVYGLGPGLTAYVRVQIPELRHIDKIIEVQIESTSPEPIGTPENWPRIYRKEHTNPEAPGAIIGLSLIGISLSGMTVTCQAAAIGW